MNALREISKLSSKLPLEVLQDIDMRIGDWLAQGGQDDDPYFISN